MKLPFKLSILGMSLLMGSALAGGPEVPMNQTGLYIGFGGSYNSVKVEDYTQFKDGSNSTTEEVTTNTFAPYTQVGYFTPIVDSWLLGAKTWYKYLDAHESASLDYVPHEFSMMATVGYLFANSFFYLGAGSILFDGIDNYAVTDSHGKFVKSASESKVMWGGAGQVGWSYYLSPTWFLDMAYTYAISGHYHFVEQRVSQTDNLLVNAQVRSQELVASVNKVFAL